MKEILKELRPYEKCLACGPQALGDDELLAVILRTGSKGENVTELSRRLLSATDGLTGLLNRSLPELKALKGIGDVKAIQLQCIGELSRRIWTASQKNRLDCADSYSVYQYYKERLRHETREMALIVMLDTKNRRMGDVLLSVGTNRETIVSPREVLCECLRHQASSFILLHNHPSGDPSPSRADIAMTQRVQEAGKLIGIPLIDHIIIGDNKYTSFREKRVLL